MRKWRGFADNGACPVGPTGGGTCRKEGKALLRMESALLLLGFPWEGRADVFFLLGCYGCHGVAALHGWAVGLSYHGSRNNSGNLCSLFFSAGVSRVVRSASWTDNLLYRLPECPALLRSCGWRRNPSGVIGWIGWWFQPLPKNG